MILFIKSNLNHANNYLIKGGWGIALNAEWKSKYYFLVNLLPKIQSKKINQFEYSQVSHFLALVSKPLL